VVYGCDQHNEKLLVKGKRLKVVDEEVGHLRIKV
jgi:hypothetical protein